MTPRAVRPARREPPRRPERVARSERGARHARWMGHPGGGRWRGKGHKFGPSGDTAGWAKPAVELVAGGPAGQADPSPRRFPGGLHPSLPRWVRQQRADCAPRARSRARCPGHPRASRPSAGGAASRALCSERPPRRPLDGAPIAPRTGPFPPLPAQLREFEVQQRSGRARPGPAPPARRVREGAVRCGEGPAHKPTAGPGAPGSSPRGVHTSGRLVCVLFSTRIWHQVCE